MADIISITGPMFLCVRVLQILMAARTSLAASVPRFPRPFDEQPVRSGGLQAEVEKSGMLRGWAQAAQVVPSAMLIRRPADVSAAWGSEAFAVTSVMQVVLRLGQAQDEFMPTLTP